MMSHVVTQFAGQHRLLEIVRFGAVGAAQNLLNLAVFALGVATGVPYLAAAVAAGGIALAASYVANRHWTFADAARQSAGAQAGRYIIVFVGASVGALGVLAFFAEVVSAPKVLAQAAALAIMAPLSYLAQRRFTFRAHLQP